MATATYTRTSTTGTLIRRPDGTVKLQDTNTGKVRSYEMTDTVTAFYTLGLCAGRRNGIDGWLELSLLPGLADRD